MPRWILTFAFLGFPLAAFSQETLYKSYMDAGWKALKAGDWKDVEKMSKMADKEAAGFKADDPRRTYPSNLMNGMYRAQSRYPEAIEVLKKSIEAAEAQGANNFAVAVHTETLGKLYLILGRPDLAEPYMRQSLKVIESQPKPEKWRIAYSLRNIADCHAAAGKVDDAELLYKQSLKELETETRPGQVGQNLSLLARLYLATDRLKEAEVLTKQALEKLAEVKTTGIMLAQAQFVRGYALAATDKPKEAAEMYKIGLTAFTSDASQTDSPELIPVLTAYAKLLFADKKAAEATKLEARAADLKAKLDKGREAISK